MNPHSAKRQRLFVVLSVIFLTNAIIAEVIGVKIFSAESALGLPPTQLPLFGYAMDFNLTAGVLLWPFVFITSDLINEYFGKSGVKVISYLTAICIAYAFLMIFISIHLPPSQWWSDAYANDADGNPFNIDFAFGKILGQGLRIIIGSLTAFLVGQLIDVAVFIQLRKRTGEKWLWLRATGSTLVSQCIDSFVVLFVAFYGTYSTTQLIAIGITNYIYKFFIALLLTPLLYIGHYFIDQYLGEKNLNK